MNEEEIQEDPSALLEEGSEAGEEKDEFEIQLEKTLEETASSVREISVASADPSQTKSWEIATGIIKDFRPVPWFIWRLSHFVFSKSQEEEVQLSEGFVFGLRRLLFAIASDPVLGGGEKVNKVRKALKSTSPGVIAASSVIHSICRRLKKMPHERIWSPILEDAILRARIGYRVGSMDRSFGAGRGMLAGFSGRAGLTVLIASGDLDQARQSLEMLATGSSIREVGMTVYKCDPLQVSVMMLSAAGCGRDAAFGTVSYSSDNPLDIITNEEQLKWLAAYVSCDWIRTSAEGEIEEEYLEIFSITDEVKEELLKDSKLCVRRGHGWGWLTG